MASFKTIYTTKGENPASVINELSKIEEDVVKIYLPQYAVFFQERSNFELLKRQADFLGKEVIILTLDKEGLGFAEASGFTTQVPSEGEGEQIAVGPGSSHDTRDDRPLEKATPKKFVDISGQPKRSLSEFEPIKKEEQVSLAQLEEEEMSLSPDRSGLKKEEQERDQELDAFLNTREKDKRDGLKIIRRPKVTFSTRRASFIGVGVIVVGLIIAALTFLPKADISVTSARQPVNFQATVFVDKNLAKVNQEASRIPGQIMEVTKSVSQSFPATGAKTSGDKAQGTVTVYNEQFVAQPMIASRFQAQGNGKIYWSQKSIVVPAATKQGTKTVPGKIDMLIMANDAGDGSSLTCSADQPCKFSVPAWQGTDRATKVYALATAAISGGGAGDNKVVTADDIKQAQAQIQDALKKAATDDLKSTLASGLKLIDESLSVAVDKVEADKAIGAAASTFIVTASGKVSAVAIKNDDINTFIDETVKSKLAQDKRTYPETIEASFKDVNVDLTKGEVQVGLSAKEEVGWTLVIDDLKRQLQGKTRDEVKSLVSGLDKISSIKVNLWPFWVSSVPTRLNRINITVQ